MSSRPWLVLWACLALPAWSAMAEAPPPMTLPQARVDAIDTSGWPHVRVLATVLDASGHPVPPRALTKLAVVDPKARASGPLAQFRHGQAEAAFPGATLQTREKAGVPLAAMVVVAGYQHESLRDGPLGQRLKDALSAGWKRWVPGDRVNALWYGDRLYRHHALPGRQNALDDVELRRQACDLALAEARAGVDESTAGVWPCGLQADPKAVGALLKHAPFRGYFPRLFALGAPFDDVGRYCAPPPESLDGFGPFTAANARAQQDTQERAVSAGQPAAFSSSAWEEALFTLLTDTRPGEQPVLLLVSDGRDGYIGDVALCQAHPPPACAALLSDTTPAGKTRVQSCIADVLGQRVAAAQQEFAVRAASWLALLRAAGIRVFAVGLGSTGRDFELERLRLLAERSGGTWRLAADDDAVGPAVLATMAELSGQLVVDVDVPVRADMGRPTTLDLALEVELDPKLTRVQTQLAGADVEMAHPRLRTSPRTAEIAPVPTTLARVQTLWLRQTSRIRLAVAVVVAALVAGCLVWLAVGLRARKRG